MNTRDDWALVLAVVVAFWALAPRFPPARTADDVAMAAFRAEGGLGTGDGFRNVRYR